MKTALLSLFGLTMMTIAPGILSEASAATKYRSSDVVKYALTAKGIRYLLRDKKGSVNAWNSNVNASRWGNTDCSGLASAAIRYGGYKAPEKKGKAALSTAGIGAAAARGRGGLSYIGNTNSMKSNATHGDLINRTGKPYGHVFIYNGENSKGLIETVEAKCTKCGVGRFTRSWSSTYKTKYRLVRSSNVVDDVNNRRKNFQLSDADGSNRTTSSAASSSRPSSTSTSSEIYKVRSGDTGAEIAKAHGVSLSALMSANPNVDWRRLNIGQKINIPA